MKKFRFRLEKVEQLRAIRKRETRARLAEALLEVGRRRDALDRADDERARAIARDPAADRDPVPAGHLHAWAAWIDGIERRLERAREERDAAESEAERCREQHVEASRDHRALELLRARRYRRWRRDVAREEQKFLDEIHLLRREHVRRADARREETES